MRVEEDGMEMDEFESGLERVLKRVEAPRGFAERVCALGARERLPAGMVLAWPARYVRLGGALAAGLMLSVAAGEGWQVHQAAQRRMAAEAQFDTAMRVTGRALEKTKVQLSRSGVRFFND